SPPEAGGDGAGGAVRPPLVLAPAPPAATARPFLLPLHPLRGERAGVRGVAPATTVSILLRRPSAALTTPAQQADEPRAASPPRRAGLPSPVPESESSSARG